MIIEPFESYLMMVGLAIFIFSISFGMGYLMQWLDRLLNKYRK